MFEKYLKKKLKEGVFFVDEYNKITFFEKTNNNSFNEYNIAEIIKDESIHNILDNFFDNSTTIENKPKHECEDIPIDDDIKRHVSVHTNNNSKNKTKYIIHNGLFDKWSTHHNKFKTQCFQTTKIKEEAYEYQARELNNNEYITSMRELIEIVYGDNCLKYPKKDTYLEKINKLSTMHAALDISRSQGGKHHKKPKTYKKPKTHKNKKRKTNKHKKT